MSSYLPSLKWPSAASWSAPSRREIAEDAPLSQLPTHESEALAELEELTLPLLQAPEPPLPTDDAWRTLHADAHRDERRGVLLRYLRFNGLDVTRTAAQIRRVLAWRATFRVADLGAEAVRGRRAGIPVARLPVVGRRREALFFAAAAQYVRKEVVVAAQEAGVARMFEEVLYAPVDRRASRAAVVVDFTGFGTKHVDIMGLKRGITTYVNYYPEAFYKVLLVNYPTLLYTVWKVVMPMLDARTVSRIIWVGKGESLAKDLGKELDEAFEREQLPRWLGGEGDDEDVKLFNGVVVEANVLRSRFS